MSRSKVLTFRYPKTLRLAISILGFVPLLILEGIIVGHIDLAPGGLARFWAFLACSVIPFLVVNIVFTELKVEEDKISLRRLFWTKALTWSEIDYVEQKPTLHRLNLRSQRGVLSIHKQFHNYPQLYSILRQRIPAGAFGPPLQEPVRIYSSVIRRMMFMAPVLVAFMGYTYSHFPQRAMTSYWLYAVALLLLVAVSYWIVLRIELETTELRMVYPFRTVNHQLKNISEVKVVQRFQEIAVRLDIAGKPFEIGEREMDVAPEQLASTLEARHGTKVRYQ